MQSLQNSALRLANPIISNQAPDWLNPRVVGLIAAYKLALEQDVQEISVDLEHLKEVLISNDGWTLGVDYDCNFCLQLPPKRLTPYGVEISVSESDQSSQAPTVMGACAHNLANSLSLPDCDCWEQFFCQSLSFDALGETALEQMVKWLSDELESTKRVLSIVFSAHKILLARLRRQPVPHGLAVTQRAFFTHAGTHPPEDAAPFSYLGLFLERVFQPQSAV